MQVIAQTRQKVPLFLSLTSDRDLNLRTIDLGVARVASHSLEEQFVLNSHTRLSYTYTDTKQFSTLLPLTSECDIDLWTTDMGLSRDTSLTLEERLYEQFGITF